MDIWLLVENLWICIFYVTSGEKSACALCNLLIYLRCYPVVVCALLSKEEIDMRAQKKYLAAALSVVMAVGSLPTAAMAAAAPEGTTGWFYDEDRGGVAVLPGF